MFVYITTLSVAQAIGVNVLTSKKPLACKGSKKITECCQGEKDYELDRSREITKTKQFCRETI
jgi:hypothetical protein